MDAVEALEEIAFRLERELASKYRAKAFRKAAAIIQPLSAAEVANRVADGSLKRMAGIGDTTYAVIEQAADGRVPDYLAELRARDAPADAPASGLRTRLRGDLHAHTDWSDGTTSIESMARAAEALGHEYLAITDHSPNLRVANGLSAERLTEQIEIIEGIDAHGGGIRLLTGIEVDILPDGTLDQAPEMLAQLDLVVASVHSKLRTESEAMTRRMLGGVNDPRTNILGHCTGRLVQGSRGTRPPSTFDARRVFAACAEKDVAVEINSRPERQDPPDDLIALALAEGCLFSIDSDAHAPGQLGLLDLGAARAEAAGVPPERIITTWPLEKLLEWARPAG
ncbi:PHP domain-containing protein [Glaciibacter flavus]|uniref:PHP domain-containing protein n=1 Tax=Orlajensenia flava TaxID=2565934 RepID=A0A4S4FQK9_9MICO|nr:PHP domain-containing protein [Glaciibacter flavus]THG32634.1 PHP domain-containing protein [Glaciibacter flavus]